MTKTNYKKISCKESNRRINEGPWVVYSAGTDESTNVRTIVRGLASKRLMDIRYQSEHTGKPDLEPCEHYTWTETEAEDD